MSSFFAIASAQKWQDMAVKVGKLICRNYFQVFLGGVATLNKISW